MFTLCLPIACVLLLASPGPTILGGGETVSHFDYSLDGRRLVYVAGSTATGWQLYSSRAGWARSVVAGDPQPTPSATSLSGPLIAGGRFWGFETRGTWVVYLAEQDTDEVRELYAVPIDGSAPPVRLNAELAPGADVTGFEVSANGARVVFLVNGAGEGLYSVPIGGGEPIVLNDALGFYGFSGASGFHVDPTSSHVVFQVLWNKSYTEYIWDTYTAPIDTAGAAVLLSSIDTGGFPPSVVISPGGTRVLVVFDSVESFPIDGGAPPVVLLEDFSLYRITPDDHFVLAAYAPAGHPGLYRIRIDGAGSPLLLFDETTVESPLLVTPDSTRAVFPGGLDGPDLYAVPGEIQLDDEELTDIQSSMRITPDGARVVFEASTETGVHLYSVPVNGSAAPVQLDPGLDLSPFFSFSADGSRVVYERFVGGDPTTLWSAPVDGSAAPVLLDGAAEHEVEVNPVLAQVAWVGDDGLLFVRAIDASTPPRQVSPDFPIAAWAERALAPSVVR